MSAALVDLPARYRRRFRRLTYPPATAGGSDVRPTRPLPQAVPTCGLPARYRRRFRHAMPRAARV